MFALFKKSKKDVVRALCAGVAVVAYNSSKSHNEVNLDADSAPTLPNPVIRYLDKAHCTNQQLDYITTKSNSDHVQFLKRLLTEDTVLPEEYTFSSLWKGSPLYSKYKHDNAKCVLFWENYPMLTDLLVSKLQSGFEKMETCHAQSSACMQHYEVTINQYIHNKVITNVGMTSVPWIVRNQLSSCSALIHYVFEKSGGKSLSDLCLICGLDKEDVTMWRINEAVPKKVWCEYVMNRLKRQPALVSRFDVMPGSGFAFPTDQVSYSEADVPVQWKVGEKLHSMVLVGIRVDDAGQYWFLFQNWWREKPFIEVSYEFLDAADATITFINKPIMDIPEDMEKTYEKALETAVDRGDLASVDK